MSGLLPDAEFFDDGTITFDIDLHQVVKQTTTLPYEHLQCARSVEVFLVLLHVLRQMTDAVREQRDLTFRRSGVGFRCSTLNKLIPFYLSGYKDRAFIRTDKRFRPLFFSRR